MIVNREILVISINRPIKYDLVCGQIMIVSPLTKQKRKVNAAGVARVDKINK